MHRRFAYKNSSTQSKPHKNTITHWVLFSVVLNDPFTIIYYLVGGALVKGIHPGRLGTNSGKNGCNTSGN